MARFRRRKQRQQWFPNLGTSQQEQDTYTDFPAWRSWDLFPAPNVPDTKYLDLTFDQSAEVDLQQNTLPTLADWQGSAWRLRRIVGKCIVNQVALTDAQQNLADVYDVIVTCGFIVLRTHESTGTPLEAPPLYDPMLAENIRDPWIWRRVWRLSAGAIAAPASGIFVEAHGEPFPSSNVRYGSVADGPHIDAKTNRVIADEARLFLVTSAWVIGTGSIQPIVEGFLDYRLLGSTMKTTNRRNATR